MAADGPLMAIIRTVRGFTPLYGDDCFFAETAAIIGDVVMGDKCSVWYGAVIRADVNYIRIGDHVNIQDGAVLHTLFEEAGIEIGDYVSIAHNATVHGAIIADRVLIGIGAVLLDHVEVGEYSIIAAGAVVTTGTKVEPGSIYAGSPARRIKSVDPEQHAQMIERIGNNYHMYASWYKE
jgi:carbonic anhydrase/acetyltransferase-like protein (isoleucine patch superfamily)